MFELSIVIQVIVSAIVFGYMGYRSGRKSAMASMEVIVEETINSLIVDEYIKTKGKGKDMVLLKHWEE